MFDSIIIRQEPNYPQHIHEHRAPTDESIRLAEEMREKALERILSETRLESNELNAVWWHITDHMTRSHELRCKFDLNGTKHEFSVELCMDELAFGSNERLMQKLRAAIILEVGKVISMDLFRSNSVLREFRAANLP